MPRTIARALAEHLAHVGVDREIDVALAVAQLDVGQAVPLVGQRAQRLGRRSTAASARIDSSPRLVQNAGPSATTMSPASSCGSTFAKSSGVEVIDVEEQLEIAGGVADRREHGLAHAALGHRRGRRRAAISPSIGVMPSLGAFVASARRSAGGGGGLVAS